MFKRSSYLKLAILGLAALSFTAAVSATPAQHQAPAIEAPAIEGPDVEALTNLSYPGDCDSKKLRKAAEKGGCKVESGGEHFKVSKNGTTITVIPHTVKENGTCRSIIKAINSSC